MRSRFQQTIFAAFAAALLAAAPVAAAEEAPSLRERVRALLASAFDRDEMVPAEVEAEPAGGLERELAPNVRVELRYSRGPFDGHLADPREGEHYVFLQLVARL